MGKRLFVESFNKKLNIYSGAFRFLFNLAWWNNSYLLQSEALHNPSVSNWETVKVLRIIIYDIYIIINLRTKINIYSILKNLQDR